MSPSNLQLATAECDGLLRQGVFWQVGVHPNDRHKTTFCLPNAHYQWTVLPFGLKTAISLFQKAVTRIFHPLVHSALLYIYDILLFSPDELSHARFLQHFHDILYQYGIMLFDKKSMVSQLEIDFLGMHISNGQYHPRPHPA
ncbi:hypothetical protein Dsin_002236 [Dipteronia sinensis]|uniref:Reverse transcriptase domain-containing protein n=1 Tax=Dipteronia sinensis TaxID=43782 RepID=A0AAE0B6Q3_9ROSI|nr:hypothetical protein Dsin_002236 [Dipteronia sinensis]